MKPSAYISIWSIITFYIENRFFNKKRSSSSPLLFTIKPISLSIDAFALSLSLSAQTNNPFYGSNVSKTSSSNVLNDLTALIWY